MKKVLITAAAVALMAAGQANAADIYRAPEAGGSYKDAYVPADSWTGFYVGVNGGYAWSASGDLYAYPANAGGRGGNPAFGGINPEGGFGSGQIGYNWQGALGSPHLVLGLEADIQGADISASGNDAYTPPNTWKSSVDWFGTVRGRLGYAFNGTLIYATGGFAYGNVDNSLYLPATHTRNAATYQFDGIATGYTVGGGVEYKIAPAWSVKGEYQYIDLGENDPGGIPIKQVFPGINAGDNALHTVRLGLNYRILPGYEPLK